MEELKRELKDEFKKEKSELKKEKLELNNIISELKVTLNQKDEIVTNIHYTCQTEIIDIFFSISTKS